MDRQIETRPINNQFTPNRIAQKCPVCNGFGTLAHGSKTCQGCDGKGWIVVDQQDRRTESYEDQKTYTP